MSRVALVVDDSRSIRRLVSQTMRNSGFEVVEAANGREGLDALAGRSVDVIITDYNMPLMDGLDLTRAVRSLEQCRFTPIIFLSTEIEESRRDEARQAGVTAWLQKPFDAEKVLSLVARVVPEP
jgi:two-component system, chemotaxis family, chemotaxis protein CheY